MKYIVVSDSHGSLMGLRKAIKDVPDFHGIIHLGDVENQELDIDLLVQHKAYIQISGNCDFNYQLEPERTATFGKHRVLMVHGDQHGVKRGHSFLAAYARERGCDTVFYGHTHIPTIDQVGGITVANPGSISFPRGGSKPSYIIMDIDAKGNMNLELVSIQNKYDI